MNPTSARSTPVHPDIPTATPPLKHGHATQILHQPYQPQKPSKYSTPRSSPKGEKKKKKRGEKEKKKALPYRAQNSKGLISGGAELTNRAGRAPPG
jgi:hypothetical protein|tara:strand:- start:34693 stop:34980 length:288 start_codon:yes stop_codon:yes gene_type:complete